MASGSNLIRITCVNVNNTHTPITIQTPPDSPINPNSSNLCRRRRNFEPSSQTTTTAAKVNKEQNNAMKDPNRPKWSIKFVNINLRKFTLNINNINPDRLIWFGLPSRNLCQKLTTVISLPGIPSPT